MGQPPGGSSGGAGTAQDHNTPYAFYTVALALVLASIVFALVMLIFEDRFEDAGVVTPGLGTLFGTFGTVIGAYFGIKASSDTAERSQDAIEKATQTANRALAELPPYVGSQIMGGT